tara:strand:+ start:977 stop:1186 length:210 start_codon:yes stop_codon:yes gene_type:complete
VKKSELKQIIREEIQTSFEDENNLKIIMGIIENSVELYSSEYEELEKNLREYVNNHFISPKKSMGPFKK